MADLGLLSGIAEGLKSGYESYRTERDYLDRKKQDEETKRIAKRQMALDLAKSGMMETPEGDFKETSETASKKELDKRFKEAQISEMLAKAKKEGMLAKTEKEPKSSQYAAAGYAKRAQQAEETFDQLGKEGYDPSSFGSAIQRFGLMPEAFKNENTKRQEQAERNFVNAILRPESGAAISESEFANARNQYFPKIGDTPEVIKQKAENRRLKIAGLSAEGGAAMGKVETSLAQLPSASVRQQKGLIPSAVAAPPKDLNKMSNQELMQFINSFGGK